MKLVTTAVLATALVGVAAAQGRLVYAPVKLIKDQGISLKGWGSGVITETDETAYEGTHSLRISGRNFFQGGIINFEQPVDMTQEYQDKANLLRITFKAPDSASVSGPGGAGGPAGASGGAAGGAAGAAGGPPGGPGGPPGGPPGGLGRGGGLAGGPPQGGGITGPRGGISGGASASVTPLETLRVIVTTTDGKKSEAYVPVRNAGGERGWSNVAVPLHGITGFDRTNKIVKSIAFAPDNTTTMYIGEMRLVNDTTPIRGEITPGGLNLGSNQEVRLSAIGFGGASILKYTWDFDSSDGIQVDAEGQNVTRRFRKPGTYTITLTISDVYGLKKPYTTTIKAVVNQ